MSIPIRNLEVGEKYLLGEPYENDGWARFTLFHIERNRQGGSTSWPVAEIDVVKHPSMNGCNSHTEIKISFRNEVIRSHFGIDSDGNKTKLRHPENIVDTGIIKAVVQKLRNAKIAILPISVYVCMRHIEDFWVEGDFWYDE